MSARDENTVTIDRKDFADVMNLWGVFVARLLKPAVEADPGAMSRHARGAIKAFRTAVDVQTGSPFLRDHAKDFAEALEKALIGESLQRALAKDEPVKRQDLKKPGARVVEVPKPVGGQMADSLKGGQRTLSLRRPKND